jgi:RNA polymerase sigma factor (sigma-70 family)
MARVQHTSSDALLSPYLNASSEAESESLLTTLLVEHATPVIRKIIRRKLDDRFRTQESEDVYCEVVAQLLERLRLCKTGSDNGGIQDFRNYVAVTSYNACHEYLRNKYPERRRLKNRLRYLLTHHAPFSLWQTAEGDWLSGFDTWKSSRKEIAATSKLRELHDKPEILASSMIRRDSSCAVLTDLLNAIFRNVGAPVEFETLINSVADLQGIKNHSELANLDEQEFPVKAPSQDFANEIEQRSYLRRLWSEIVQLPFRQRVALLLNLRDINDGVVMLFPLTGIATIRQIAEALEIPADEFSVLWNELPLDDAAIASRLGITRQGVINLRKSARARLSRRMRPLAFKESNKIM